MKISTEIASAARKIGEEKTLEFMGKAGFDAWDFSMFDMCKYDWGQKLLLPSAHPLAGADYLAFARKLKKIGLDHGMICNQSHAPFPTGCREIRGYFRRAIECTAEAGGSICVIHPDNDKSAEENAEMYLELLPFAKACRVKIATENMWNWDREKDESLPAACSSAEDFLAHLKAVDDPYLVACLDIGHAEMRGSGDGAAAMVRALGGWLQAMHLHDNDRWHDSHQIPFSMDIDLAEVAKALREIGYAGYVTLEADRYLGDFADDEVEQGIHNLADSARKFAALMEG